MRYLLLFFFLFWSFGIFPIEKEKNTNYKWPLDINNGYSSTFQEFRANHFHAGMDLRTFQKTGFPVYAISNGNLYKIRVVKRGSGRGLYIKHQDSNTSIYFHLDKFVEKIENIAKKVQKARGLKYFGNYFLKNPLPIMRGEIIGYSGETGYGFPHLHIEIRDREHFALNPFKWLIPPGKDFNFPVLKALLLRIKDRALINGQPGEKLIRFQRSNHQTFYLPVPIVATGKIDMVVNARDISDSGKFVAPYRLAAVIDNRNYFKLSFDRFAWEDNNQLGFVYDMFNSNPGNYFFNIFFQKGFELEEKKIFLDDVIDQLDWGKHTGKILVEDNFGNHSVGHFVIFKIKNPEIKIQNVQLGEGQVSLDIIKMSAQQADGVDIQLLNRNNKSLYTGKVNERNIVGNRKFVLKGIYDKICFLDFIFCKSGIPYYKKRFLLDNSIMDEIDEVEFGTYINRDNIVILTKRFEFSTENILLKVIQEEQSQIIPPQDSIDGIFFHFKPMNTSYILKLEFILLKEKKEIRTFQKNIKMIYLLNGIKKSFRDGGFEAEFEANTVKEPQLLKFEEKNFFSAFPVLSRQISLSPYHFPFLDMVRYKFNMDLHRPNQVGIFKYNFRKRKWGYVHTNYDPFKKIYSTKVISSGTFALMRDIFKPEIRLMKLQSFYLDRLKQVVIQITDKGKGVDDSTLQVFLNNKMVDCEYDPDWRHVLIEDLKALRPSHNILKVKVDDWGGNHSSKTFQFYLK